MPRTLQPRRGQSIQADPALLDAAPTSGSLPTQLKKASWTEQMGALAPIQPRGGFRLTRRPRRSPLHRVRGRSRGSTAARFLNTGNIGKPKTSTQQLTLSGPAAVAKLHERGAKFDLVGEKLAALGLLGSGGLDGGVRGMMGGSRAGSVAGMMGGRASTGVADGGAGSDVSSDAADLLGLGSPSAFGPPETGIGRPGGMENAGTFGGSGRFAGGDLEGAAFGGGPSRRGAGGNGLAGYGVTQNPFANPKGTAEFSAGPDSRIASGACHITETHSDTTDSFGNQVVTNTMTYEDDDMTMTHTMTSNNGVETQSVEMVSKKTGKKTTEKSGGDSSEGTTESGADSTEAPAPESTGEEAAEDKSGGGATTTTPESTPDPEGGAGNSKGLPAHLLGRQHTTANSPHSLLGQGRYGHSTARNEAMAAAFTGQLGSVLNPLILTDDAGQEETVVTIPEGEGPAGTLVDEEHIVGGSGGGGGSHTIR